MLYFMLGAGVLALSAAFRLAAVFRLTIPLLYALIVPTLFHDWFYSHQALAEGIWYVLLGLVLLSWVISLIRKISAWTVFGINPAPSVPESAGRSS